MKLFNVVVCVFCGLLLFPGCSKTKPSNSISFENDNGILAVSNETGEELVLFAGNPAKNTVLGGIRAQETRGFDLRKIPDIPGKGAFLVRAVAFETYKDKPDLSLDDVVYTGLVAYNLENTDDKINLLISEYIDITRQTCIYASNESKKFVLELRQGNPRHGEIIGTLPPEQSGKIYLCIRDDGLPYDIYPVFVYVNPITGEKTSMSGGKEDRKRIVPEPVGKEMIPIRFEEPQNTNIPIEDILVQLFNE